MQGADFGSKVTDKGDRETERGPSVRRRRVHDLSLLDLRCSRRRVMAMQLQAAVILVVEMPTTQVVALVVLQARPFPIRSSLKHVSADSSTSNFTFCQLLSSHVKSRVRQGERNVVDPCKTMTAALLMCRNQDVTYGGLPPSGTAERYLSCCPHVGKLAGIPYHKCKIKPQSRVLKELSAIL